MVRHPDLVARHPEQNQSVTVSTPTRDLLRTWNCAASRYALGFTDLVREESLLTEVELNKFLKLKAMIQPSRRQ